jgi:hypothetical protein
VPWTQSLVPAPEPPARKFEPATVPFAERPPVLFKLGGLALLITVVEF